MDKTARTRILFWGGTLIYALLLTLFYWRYVPLIRSFQAVFFPLLLLTAVVTAVDVFKGILLFVFLFPLINNLPYFFGIDSHIPHAPAALVLFVFLLLGWLVYHCRRPLPERPCSALQRPLGLLTAIILLSALINLLRFRLPLPCLSGGVHDAVMNVNGLTSGGAVMSTVFNGLNYLSGFMFFFMLVPQLGDKLKRNRILGVFSFSFMIALFFGLLQHVYSPRLGNMKFWISKGQINATFKDPNSLALILSAFIPLLLGMLLGAGKRRRLFLGLLLGMALFIFPLTGSRISLLGLAGGVAGFLMLALSAVQQKKNRRLVFIFIFLSVVLVSASLFFSLAPKTQLAVRFQRTWKLIGQGDSLRKVFTSRLDFWPAAWKMMKEYPISGVGVGGFIVELPNYLKMAGPRYQYTDSAENYFLQIASELGAAGLAVFGWLFWLIFVRIKSRWRRESVESRESKYLFMGLCGSFLSIFINVFFHSYIGAFDVKYFVWILIALLFAGRDEGHPADAASTPGRRRFVVIMIVPLLFGGVHLWNAFHSLSTDARMKRFQWEHQIGFHAWERDESGIDFRWMGKTAFVFMKRLPGEMILPVRCSHPDLDQRPVTLRIYEGNSCMRKLRKVTEIIFSDRLWHDVVLDFSGSDRLYMKLEVDRIWQPSQWGASDSRKLGVVVGRMWFRPFPGPPSIDLKSLSKRRYKNWLGPQKSVMASPGISRISFDVPGAGSLLRLRVRGNRSGRSGPFIIIRIDDRIVGKIVLTSEEWTALDFTPVLEIGSHHLSVEFLDPVGESDTEPRIVRLGGLVVYFPSVAVPGPL